jgi:Motility related/secretion protein
VRRPLGLLIFIFVALCLASSVFGASGTLNLSFSSNPSLIAPWFEPVNEFSAALEPRYQMNLGNEKLLTIPDSSCSYDSGSVTFEQEYYRLGKKKYKLIPMTVDARSYSLWRRDWTFNDRMNESLRRNMADPQRAGQRQGLGVNIQLPKRLDKIFGEGGAGLKVSGYQSIEFKGQSSWNDDVGSDQVPKTKFPDLLITQESRIDIAGNIGSKITVKVTQDTQSDIPLANRIQLRYKGDEDDILKVIEAGNTNLSIPSTQFVGYSQNISGLFGIKTEAQIGGLRLVGIASQEQGSSEKTSISPTGEESANYLRDYNYADGRIFDLFRPGEVQPGDSVTKLLIYEQEEQADKANRIVANLYVSPNSPDSFKGEKQGPIHVLQRNTTEYKFFSDPLNNQHIVVFSYAQSSSRTCGYFAQVVRNGNVISFGNLKTTGTSDTITLKLLRVRESIASPASETWKLMWRNCYPAPPGVSVSDMEVKIIKGAPDQQGKENPEESQDEGGAANLNNYLAILGLDLHNSVEARVPDGKMDQGRREIFWSELGLIIFPNREPFNTDTTFAVDNGLRTPSLRAKVPSIYNYNSATEKTLKTEYYIQIATKTRASIIHLNRSNIIEGSERVIVNGQQLTKGTDYSIEYDFGKITLMSSAALDPNATINIDFEYAPFFAVQKKTLMGLRAEYDWSKDFSLGSTVLYKTDKAQDRKPRVGQETTKHVVYTFDADWRLKMPFVTKAINALPLIRTEAPSGLSISAEIAQSRPNPNVDGEAYIDDFEAAVEDISLGTSRTTFQLSSRPLNLDQNFVRSKLVWFTPVNLPNHGDVYSSEAAPGQGVVRTMKMVFRPKTLDTAWAEIVTGADTALSPDTIRAVDTVSWAGITRYFGSRVDAARVQLFEMRAKIGVGMKGRLHFDFGRVSEDLDLYGAPDGSGFSEDIDGNKKILDNEDTGLDGKKDNIEDPKKRRAGIVDPNGDNWFFEGSGICPIPGGCINIPDSQKYDWINGTEGNYLANGERGVPDAEALSVDGFKQIDAYFSYVIDFADTGKFAVRNFVVPGSELGPEESQWKTYQIPIMDSSFRFDKVEPSQTDTANWAAVRHVRVWLESTPGQKTNDTLEIADWYFVQSNWQDSLISAGLSDKSTQFRVVSVSEEDNTFDPPPGVEPYKDPTSGVLEPQRGLELKFDDLEYQDTCLAYRDLLSGEMYSGYRRMKMYVHGTFETGDEGKVKFFFRVGRDGNNFYEYQRYVYEGWDARNAVDIDFNELTAFKDAQQKVTPIKEWGKIDAVDTVRGFRVKGNPSITQVQYFAAGVINDKDSLSDLTGSVWMDELRVSEVRRDAGTAGRVSVSGTMADFMSYSFSLVSKDAYFKELSSAPRGGSGSTTTTLTSSVTMQAHKFLPPSWGASLPISVSYSKTVGTPVLRTNSDIVLPDSVRKAEQSIADNRNFSISESFSNKGKNPLFNLFLNRYKSTFSYRRTSMTSVRVPYNFGESFVYRGDMDLNWEKLPSLSITGWLKKIPLLKKTSKTKLYFYPTTWTISGDYNRSINISRDADSNRLWSVQKSMNGSMNVAYKVFDNFSLNGNFTTTRDLSNFGRPKTFLPGLETRFQQNFGSSYDPKLLSWLTIGTSYKATYSDDWERGTKSRRVAASKSYGVNGKFDHHLLLQGGGATQSRSTTSASSRRQREEKRKKAMVEALKKDSTGVAQKSTEKKKDKEKDDAPGKSIWRYPIDGLRFATGWIQPITYTYSESYGSIYPSLTGRPDWRFRYGLTKSPNKELFGKTVVGLSRTQSKSSAMDFGSGFTFLKGLAVDVRYTRSETKDIEKQGTLTRTVTKNFPDLTIRISQFKGIPYVETYINKFVQMFSPRTDYRREERWSEDIGGKFEISRSITTSWSPLLSVNFKLKRDLSITGSYATSTDEEIKNNPDTGGYMMTSLGTRSTFGLSTSYSFSAPGGINIPLFGRLKFRSTVKIDFDAKKNFQKSETKTLTKTSVGLEKSDLQFNLNVGYTFSQQVTGGLHAKWSKASDATIDQNTYLVDIGLYARITF